MTVQLTELFYVIVATLLVWLFSLFILVPMNFRSMLRYKLWQIRDDAIDAGLRESLI